MSWETYKSTLVDGVFVTMPSNAGKATIGMVDELSALGLEPMLRPCDASGDENEALERFIMTEIVLKGYATHGDPRYVR